MLACRVPWKLIRAIVEREPAAAPTNNAHRGHHAYLFGAAAWKKAEAEAPAVISEPRAFLQKTRLGELVRCALTNHEMVKYPHVDKRQGRLQLLGQQAIRIGWLGGARGVLMGEDDRSGVQLQSALPDTEPALRNLLLGAWDWQRKSAGVISDLDTDIAR